MKWSEWQYYVLCEDERQYQFVRGFLLEKQANKYKINLLFRLPEGKGSGGQFVEIKFGEALDEQKRRSAGTRTILVVVRDADVMDYDAVAKKFDEGAPLFLIIPKRNIETWFYFLDNSSSEDCANEEIDRKKLYTEVSPVEYGRKMAKYDFSQLSKLPDSLEKTVKNICEQVRK